MVKTSLFASLQQEIVDLDKKINPAERFRIPAEKLTEVKRVLEHGN